MLPPSVSVPALKKRIDLVGDRTHDALLSELLEGAFATAQSPAPYGCGRLLLPDPLPEPDSSGVDQAQPVDKTFTFRGHTMLVPDAREITAVEIDGVLATDPVPYSLVERDGVITRLDLPHERHEFWFGADNPPEWQNCHWRNRQHTVKLTGRFGLYPLPSDLREAIYRQAGREWIEHQSQYAEQSVEGAPAQFARGLPWPKTVYSRYALSSGYLGLS